MEFLHIWNVVRKRKLLLIVVFLIVFLSAVAASFLLTPVYKATAKLFIQESTMLTSLLSDAGISSSKLGGDEFDTKIGLAQTRPLLDQVIEQLKLKDKKGDLMDAEDLVTGGILNNFIPSPYIYTEQYKDSYIIYIISQSKDANEAANMSNLMSSLYVNRVIERTRKDFTWAKNFLSSEVKKKEADYQDSLAAARDFLLKANMADFSKEKDGVIDKVKSLQSSLEDTEKEIQQTQRELAVTEKKLAERDQYRKESKTYALNEEITNLKTKINNYVLGIASKRVLLRDEHTDIQQVLKELEAARAALNSEKELVLNKEQFEIDPIYDKFSQSLATNYVSLQLSLLKKKIFTEYMTRYQAKLKALPALDAERSKLETDLSTKKELYASVRMKLLRVEMAEAFALSNIKIVENAVPPKKPKFPKKALFCFLGFIFGWIWALAVVCFVEYIDNTVQTPSDLKKASTLKYLGELPKTKHFEEGNLIADLPPSAPMMESYRSIIYDIHHLPLYKNGQLKSMMITSCVAGEGKSLFASNLAIALSLEGKRVLLVDLNFRNPALGKIFSSTLLMKNGEQKINPPDESEQEGLSNVLSDDKRFNPPVFNPLKNLYVVKGGSVPENPAGLIASEKLARIVEDFKKEYDIIILDAPAISFANDALVIGHLADGILLVVEAGRITPAMINDAAERLKQFDIVAIGAVLNQCISKGADYVPYRELFPSQFFTMLPFKKLMDRLK